MAAGMAASMFTNAPPPDTQPEAPSLLSSVATPVRAAKTSVSVPSGSRPGHKRQASQEVEMAGRAAAQRAAEAAELRARQGAVVAQAREESALPPAMAPYIAQSPHLQAAHQEFLGNQRAAIILMEAADADLAKGDHRKATERIELAEAGLAAGHSPTLQELDYSGKQHLLEWIGKHPGGNEISGDELNRIEIIAGEKIRDYYETHKSGDRDKDELKRLLEEHITSFFDDASTAAQEAKSSQTEGEALAGVLNDYSDTLIDHAEKTAIAARKAAVAKMDKVKDQLRAYAPPGTRKGVGTSFDAFHGLATMVGKLPKELGPDLKRYMKAVRFHLRQPVAPLSPTSRKALVRAGPTYEEWYLKKVFKVFEGQRAQRGTAGGAAKASES